MGQRAVLLDRDGTLVEARHYPSRPEQLVLYPGIAADLRRLQAAGFLLIVITNQSGVARGLFGEAELTVMHNHLRARLGEQGVRIDGVYFCPHHPEGTIAELAIVCDCRKPAPGMLLRAAREHDIDLGRSWFVGDILDDVEAGRRAGCRTILVDLGSEQLPTTLMRQPDFVARDTRHALAIIASEELGGASERDYLPPAWRAAEARA
jgi:D-glycero-D-manno-heptose 1,7-bisphosphate phosphatase